MTDGSAILGPPIVRADCQFWLIGAASAGGRLVVLADYCMRRCCGRVGSSFLSASAAKPVGRGARGVFAWLTRGGGHWRRARLQEIDTYPWAVTKGRPGLLALAHLAGQGESVITSTNGVSWEPVSQTPNGRVGRVATLGDRVVALATTRAGASLSALTGGEWTPLLEKEGWTINAWGRGRGRAR